MNVTNPVTFAISAILIAVGGVRTPAQNLPQQTGGLPMFEHDSSWPPPLPSNWVLGPVSSIAIDVHDHIWLLHRPRLVALDKKSFAAPPVLEFDAAGKFLQAWGGAGAGFEWPENEHGIFVDDKDIVWIARQAG